RTTPLAHLTCWIGLDDSTRENGCLNYVPGSHKWPDLPKPVLTGEMDGIRDILPEELKDEFKPVAVELKKGESSFHHARTMHGSRSISISWARWCISCSFAPSSLSNRVFCVFPSGSVTVSARISGVRVSIHAANCPPSVCRRSRISALDMVLASSALSRSIIPKKSKPTRVVRRFLWTSSHIRVEMATCVNIRATERTWGATTKAYFHSVLSSAT